eukprot:m.252118 g.252118  ORF g.252118 m.252118 type:complete len:357 (+) comp17526_c0_seq3:6057-7127(+)
MMAARAALWRTAHIGRRCLHTRLVYQQHGDPSAVLTLETVDNPLTPPSQLLWDQVNIQFLASSINPADMNQIQGVYPRSPPLPAVGGNEGVARVIDVGNKVTRLKPGDHVVCIQPCLGTWQTGLTTSQDNLLPVASDLDLGVASTLTVSTFTAYRMLLDFVTLPPGSSVIQNGATSAVGQAVIQLASALGLKTINVMRMSRPDAGDMIERLKKLGATHVVDEADMETAETRRWLSGLNPGLALNCVGGKSATNLSRVLATNGTMVTYGGMSKRPLQLSTASLIFKNLQFRGFWMTRWQEYAEYREKMAMMEELQDIINTHGYHMSTRRHTLDQFETAIAQAQAPHRTAKDIFIMPA